MKLINKKRQSGKTIGLIYTSEATGYSIICNTVKERKYITELAEQMGCNIPQVYTYEEVQNGMKGSDKIDKTVDAKFLYDNIEVILQDALEQYLGCKLFAVTLSNDSEIKPKFGVANVGAAYNMEESDYADRRTAARMSSGLDEKDDSDIESLLEVGN